jgi:protein ImuA
VALCDIDGWHNTVYKYSIMPTSNSNFPSPSCDRLQALLSRSDIWRASAAAGSSHNRRPRSRRDSAVDTGYDALNEALVAQGWPLTGLVELQSDAPGFGEWPLLLPALAGRHIALIGPPHIPYAPALMQAGVDLRQLLVITPPDAMGLLWAAEQVLRSGACDALLLWEPKRFFQYRELRKLQLAASQSQGLFFLLRSSRSARQVSPAVLRINLKPEREALSLTLLKQRGGQGQLRVSIPAPALWQALPTLSQMPVGLQRCANDVLLASNEPMHSSDALSTQIPLV